MDMLQSSISSSSSFSYGFTYDVFLSFRGSDTRYGFTGNLHKDLCKKGIRTFIDNRELQGGDEITPSLYKAIEESRIFIPILSINYASSSFCLDELVHIINCFKESERLVLPVFYGVEPSHVRHQDGDYGKALAEHIERFKNNKDGMERLQKWKSALTQTANFSGYYFNPRNGYEYEFIAKIVKYVSRKIIGEVPYYLLSSHCFLTSFLFPTLLAMLQSSFSSSAYSYGLTYNVFLSFRGRDTRYGFTGNLYRALCDKGIHTFIDDKELQGGDEIKPSLFKAIEESRIFIPILSINYASSSFCLDELVHIIHRFKESGRLVLPIFYDVEPYHVRNQNGSYGKALAEHIEKFQSNKDNMERFHEWKTALTQTANFSGHHFNPRNGYEYECIEKIVKYVSNKINRVPLYPTDYPIGLNSRVLKVNSFVDVGSSGVVHMLGIYGIGGVGKTTLARAVYNSIADQFDGLCFLHDIRENSARYGLEHLQRMLLSKLVELELNLGHVSEGIPIIKHSLHRKKVLLILDDVHELKQLLVLAGGLDWFGPGSRVIITTRNKQLLAGHGIEKVYEID